MLSNHCLLLICNLVDKPLLKGWGISNIYFNGKWYNQGTCFSELL